MSMGRDYVFELQPSTGVLLTPQVIYEHWEPWCNDVDRVKLLIRPPELSGNPTSNHLVAKQVELVKNMMNLPLQSIFGRTSKGYLTCRNIYDMRLYCPSEGRRAADFYRPRLGLNPRTLSRMWSTLNITPPRTAVIRIISCSAVETMGLCERSLWKVPSLMVTWADTCIHLYSRCGNHKRDPLFCITSR
jgi:hypothetical protein